MGNLSKTIKNILHVFAQGINLQHGDNFKVLKIADIPELW